MDAQLKGLEEKIAAIPDCLDLENLDCNPESKVKISLGLAFGVASLYYSLLRAQGRVKFIEEHECLNTSTKDIKGRYQKLSQSVSKRDAKLQAKQDA